MLFNPHRFRGLQEEAPSLGKPVLVLREPQKDQRQFLRVL